MQHDDANQVPLETCLFIVFNQTLQHTTLLFRIIEVFLSINLSNILQIRLSCILQHLGFHFLFGSKVPAKKSVLLLFQLIQEGQIIPRKDE